MLTFLRVSGCFLVTKLSEQTLIQAKVMWRAHRLIGHRSSFCSRCHAEVPLPVTDIQTQHTHTLCCSAFNASSCRKLPVCPPSSSCLQRTFNAAPHLNGVKRRRQQSKTVDTNPCDKTETQRKHRQSCQYTTGRSSNKLNPRRNKMN